MKQVMSWANVQADGVIPPRPRAKRGESAKKRKLAPSTTQQLLANAEEAEAAAGGATSATIAQQPLEALVAGLRSNRQQEADRLTNLATEQFNTMRSSMDGLANEVRQATRQQGRLLGLLERYFGLQQQQQQQRSFQTPPARGGGVPILDFDNASDALNNQPTP